MKVLLVGKGGREHVLAVALEASTDVTRLYAAPGNPGIGEVAELVEVADTSPSAIADMAEALVVDLVVVGPEDPLVAGAVDALRARGIRAFGPTASGARLEGSKAFAKAVMARQGVPTARSWSFDDPDAAGAHIRGLGGPWVVKADGLAAGKGVTVTERRAEAEAAVRSAMVDRRFGASGATVVIEEYLEGPELSLLVLTDGKEHIPLAPAQDHKRIGDGDEGPMTGGMGAYSPVSLAPPALVERIMETIAEPTLDGIAKETGEPYRGVLYCGLMVTEEGPKVVEFNCRFGDPEAQVVLPRLVADVADLLASCADGGLAQRRITWLDRACVTVVLAAPGYPDTPRTGGVIEGVEKAGERPGVAVFHAGTAYDDMLSLVTAGGRVLDVTAMGADVAEARTRAYDAIDDITFDGMTFRRDIASGGMGVEHEGGAHDADHSGGAPPYRAGPHSR